MFSHFDTVDPESDHHWNQKVKQAKPPYSLGAQIEKAWSIFDKNGDGKLTKQEFRYRE